MNLSRRLSSPAPSGGSRIGAPHFLGSVLQPILELIGDLRQGFPGDSFPLALGVEEAQHTFGLLERLDQSVQQETVKTPIPELDAILVMLDEGVHGTLLCGEIPGAYTAVNASRSMAISKPARTFQDLLVWQKAHRFVLEVYALTATLPKQETYGLSLQMRRAAVSIPAPFWLLAPDFLDSISRRDIKAKPWLVSRVNRSLTVAAQNNRDRSARAHSIRASVPGYSRPHAARPFAHRPTDVHLDAVRLEGKIYRDTI